jgi:teichuronic acid biosynthesis glycosyltransferase TuaC
MNRPLRLLLFSTLYPSASRPRHGLFVETRLRKLLDTSEVEAKVVAPVPWFFSTNARYGVHADMARTPRREQRHGIDVLHPRYPLPPKVGMSVAPFALAAGALGTVRRLLDKGFDFDLIDAHYYYPDGVAAALLARHVGKPFTVTARGSDLNVLSGYAVPRRLMQWAAARAAASIGVSDALVDVLRRWHIDPARLHVMRNGVDLSRFRPAARDEARRRLGLDGHPLVLAVGNLVEVKGHELLLDAMPAVLARHPQARLAIVGDGPELARLQRHAARLQLPPSCIVFQPAVAQDELVPWYNAADLLVLPSRSEGCANVLLEAMACGTPVVATDVGGSRELLDDPAAGVLVALREPAALAQAMLELIERGPDRARVRAHAERFGWEPTAGALLALLRRSAAAPLQPQHRALPC